MPDGGRAGIDEKSAVAYFLVQNDENRRVCKDCWPMQGQLSATEQRPDQSCQWAVTRGLWLQPVRNYCLSVRNFGCRRFYCNQLAPRHRKNAPAGLAPTVTHVGTMAQSDLPERDQPHDHSTLRNNNLQCYLERLLRTEI